MKTLRSGIVIMLPLFFMLPFFVAQSHEGMASDQTCRLTVTHASGAPAKFVDVSTDVSGGISCSGGRSFETNGEGQVTLRWVKGCYLRKIYIKGKGYTVDYREGGTYQITIP
jgi:hypothetical protein